MTQDNPFGDGANPFGDLGAMLEQAQQMQAQLMAAQEELARSSFTGSAGNVTVTVTGTGDLTAVAIAPGTVDASDPESLADLGDLVVAAFRDAKTQGEAAAAAALGPLAGGLGGLGELGGGAPGATPGPLGFGPVS